MTVGWHLCVVIVFSQLGYLTREALVLLQTNVLSTLQAKGLNDAVFYPGIYPNVLGALLMGLFSADDVSETAPWRDLFRVAFCGSLTTLSTLAVDALSVYPFPYDMGAKMVIYPPLQAMETLCLTWAASYAAYLAGRHVMAPHVTWRPQSTPILITCCLAVCSLVSVGVSLWALATQQSDYLYLAYGVLLAPFGTALRMTLRRVFWRPPEAKYAERTRGTLLANWTATVIACVLYLATRTSRSGFSLHGNAIFTAVGHGFCGCLSTLSSVAAEVYVAPSSRHALRYVGKTFAMALFFSGITFFINFKGIQ